MHKLRWHASICWKVKGGVNVCPKGGVAESDKFYFIQGANVILRSLTGISLLPAEKTTVQFQRVNNRACMMD